MTKEFKTFVNWRRWLFGFGAHQYMHEVGAFMDNLRVACPAVCLILNIGPLQLTLTIKGKPRDWSPYS